MMTLREFENSVKEKQPPRNISVYLQSLWYEANNNWSKAHSLIDSLSGSPAAAVHAYLHRVEGDNGNANYWYKKANKCMPEISLQEEWEALAEELLKLK